MANQELKNNPGRPDSETSARREIAATLRGGHPDQPELAAAHQRGDGASPWKPTGIWSEATSVAACVTPL